ncbi:MAG: hypothetical protein H6807_16685 [Planctomycetes bacterium]|nr:hypothetical protein [Planctomycetota bacterium]
MKSYLQEFDCESERIHLPDELADRLGIEDKTHLYAVLMATEGDETTPPDEPRSFRLIASTYPVESWGRLLRAAFTIPSEPGMLAKLLAWMTRKSLYPRHIECIQGLPTSTSRLLLSHPNRSEPLRFDRPNDVGEATANVYIVFEIPHPEFIGPLAEDDPRAPHALDDETLRRAHKLLQAACGRKTRLDGGVETSAPLEVPTATRALRRVVAAEFDQKVILDWVSPLKTIDAISRGSTFAALQAAWQKIPIKKDGDHLMVELEHWGRYLNPRARASIDRRDGTKPKAAAIITAEIQDKLLVVDFLPLDKVCVAEFEVVTPTRGLEHLWSYWVFDEIKKGGGDVLAANTRGRRRGRWGSVSAIVKFEVSKGEGLDASLVDGMVGAFRNIDGGVALDPKDKDPLQAIARRMGLPDPEHLRERITNHCLLEDDLVAAALLNLRRDTMLKQVRFVAAWRELASSSELRHGYAPSPYRFTVPIYEETRSALYPSWKVGAPKRGTRWSMARKICERLVLGGENVALIGGHRSGKTSTLAMVETMIRDEIRKALQQERAEKEPGGDAPDRNSICPIPIPIDPTLHTPYDVGREMLQRTIDYLRNLEAEERNQDQQATSGKKVKKAKKDKSDEDRGRTSELKRACIETITTIEQRWKHHPALLLAYAALADDANAGAVTAAGKGGQRGAGPGPEIPHQDSRRTWQAYQFRAAIAVVRDVVREQKEAGFEFLPIIIIDELGESPGRDEAEAYHSWRREMELESDVEIRWLVASTQSVADSIGGYSSLGGALREYNLEPLSDEEVDELMRGFTETRGRPGRRPVLANDAVEYVTNRCGGSPYLLQVCCAHLYDDATDLGIPVVGRAQAEQVFERRVYGELTDYFENAIRRWRRPEDLERANGSAALRDLLGDPRFSKFMERQGLLNRGKLVPLFEEWWDRQFRRFDEGES